MYSCSHLWDNLLGNRTSEDEDRDPENGSNGGVSQRNAKDSLSSSTTFQSKIEENRPLLTGDKNPRERHSSSSTSGVFKPHSTNDIVTPPLRGHHRTNGTPPFSNHQTILHQLPSDYEIVQYDKEPKPAYNTQQMNINRPVPNTFQNKMLGSLDRTGKSISNGRQEKIRDKNVPKATTQNCKVIDENEETRNTQAERDLRLPNYAPYSEFFAKLPKMGKHRTSKQNYELSSESGKNVVDRSAHYLKENSLAGKRQPQTVEANSRFPVYSQEGNDKRLVPTKPENSEMTAKFEKDESKTKSTYDNFSDQGIFPKHNNSTFVQSNEIYVTNEVIENKNITNKNFSVRLFSVTKIKSNKLTVNPTALGQKSSSVKQSNRVTKKCDKDFAVQDNIAKLPSATNKTLPEKDDVETSLSFLQNAHAQSMRSPHGNSPDSHIVIQSKNCDEKMQDVSGKTYAGDNLVSESISYSTTFAKKTKTGLNEVYDASRRSNEQFDGKRLEHKSINKQKEDELIVNHNTITESYIDRSDDKTSHKGDKKPAISEPKNEERVLPAVVARYDDDCQASLKEVSRYDDDSPASLKEGEKTEMLTFSKSNIPSEANNQHPPTVCIESSQLRQNIIKCGGQHPNRHHIDQLTHEKKDESYPLTSHPSLTTGTSHPQSSTESCKNCEQLSNTEQHNNEIARSDSILAETYNEAKKNITRPTEKIENTTQEKLVSNQNIDREKVELKLEDVRIKAESFVEEIEKFQELEDSNKYYYIEESLRRLVDKLDDMYDDIGDDQELRDKRKTVYKFIFPLFENLDSKVTENKRKVNI